MALGFMIITFSACKEDTDKYLPECKKNNTGTIELDNRTSHAITIYIDGKDYGQMEKGEIKPIELPVGTHTVKHEYLGCGGKDNEVEIGQCQIQMVILMPC